MVRTSCEQKRCYFSFNFFSWDTASPPHLSCWLLGTANAKHCLATLLFDLHQLEPSHHCLEVTKSSTADLELLGHLRMSVRWHKVIRSSFTSFWMISLKRLACLEPCGKNGGGKYISQCGSSAIEIQITFGRMTATLTILHHFLSIWKCDLMEMGLEILFFKLCHAFWGLKR